jgi:hypothetical protein
MEERFSDIKKAVDQLLKTNSIIKRKKKAYQEKQKDIFFGFITAMHALQARSHLSYTELGLDLSTYDELYLQVIDTLVLLHFGKEGYELISWYLYEKFNPDGSVDELYDDNNNLVPSSTPDEIWNILAKLKKDNET